MLCLIVFVRRYKRKCCDLLESKVCHIHLLRVSFCVRVENYFKVKVNLIIMRLWKDCSNNALSYRMESSCNSSSLNIINYLKGGYYDHFWIHQSKWSFWYMKAPIFLITHVKFYVQQMSFCKSVRYFVRNRSIFNLIIGQ